MAGAGWAGGLGWGVWVGGWLGWAGRLGAGLVGWGLGGWRLAGLGWLGTGGSPETEIGLFENGKVVSRPKI